MFNLESSKYFVCLIFNENILILVYIINEMTLFSKCASCAVKLGPLIISYV